MQACNGAIAGMVSVCAAANVIEPWAAWVIGIVGGCVFRGVSHLVHRMKVDDAVDAAAVHLGTQHPIRRAAVQHPTRQPTSVRNIPFAAPLRLLTPPFVAPLLHAHVWLQWVASCKTA
jgi:hypothetical protein